MPLASIAAAVILIVCFLVIPSNLKKSTISYFAETTFHNYVMQQPDLAIRSRDVETVQKYLQQQTKSRLLLPKMKGGVSLIGASLSEVDGIKVSQVFYMYGEIPVFVMIMCNTDFLSEQRNSINFSGMKEVSIAELKVFYKDNGYCGHCQIIGWKEAENQYVIVSKLKRDEMMRMLTKA